jgi:thiamine biosynthesis lipoprotein
MIHKTLFILSLFCILFTSCRDKKNPYANFTGFAQGTTYNITYENENNLDPYETRQNVEKILEGFDMSLSLYKDSSIISKVNRNEEVILDSFFINVFSKSVKICEMTGGVFDITVGPLVNAWGFGPDAIKNFTESKRDSLMRLVGIEKVTISNRRIVKKNPGMRLDFNAIAQGYSVDVICNYFDRQGIKNYLVEIGGEVRVKGTKAGAMWRIGIDKPEDNNMSPGQTLEAIILLKDKALATSGNYRKFYIEDGVKYSHTIDPKTGYPVKNTLLSATIIAADCALADGIATACMVMGKENAIEFLKQYPQFDGYLIYSDENGNFQTWISDNIKDFISETDKD